MKKLKCLFIEDSQTDVEILEWELKKKGIFLDYIIVDTEGELCRTLLDNEFDLIVCDHNMPRLDSITALMKCRILAPDVPFVVNSFYIPADVMDCLKSQNIAAIINKQDIEEFYQCILPLLEKLNST